MVPHPAWAACGVVNVVLAWRGVSLLLLLLMVARGQEWLISTIPGQNLCTIPQVRPSLGTWCVIVRSWRRPSMP